MSTMNNLVEIVQTVRASGQTDSDILAYFQPKKSLSYRLVEGLCSWRWKTDEEALNELYPGTSKANNGKYRQLKSSVRQKLLNILLYTAPDGAVKSSIEAKAKIMKLLSAGYILLSRNAANSAAEVLLQAEMLAIEYEFILHAFMAISPLESHFATIGDTKLADEIRIKKERYFGDVQARSETQQLYKRFASITNITSHFTQEMIINLESITKQLQELAEHHTIYDVIMPAKRAGVYTAMMKGDYTSALEICNSILYYFGEHPLLFNPTGFNKTLSDIALCHKELFHYEKALEYSAKAIAQTQPQTSSWALLLLEEIEISLRVGDLGRAYRGLILVTEYISLGGIREVIIEKVVLLHGFFVIAVKSQYYSKTPTREWIDLTNKFDMDIMINQAPVVIKDKAGYNTARVLLQVILFVSFGYYTSAASRETALVQYRNKYIDKQYQPRTYAFFKLILLAIEHRFDLSLIIKNELSTIQRLEPTFNNNMGVSEGFEPIEYRHLWKMFVALVESQTPGNIQ
jgi:hypothetical protein